MKYFYDTEFLEDGSTIDLISIGIVAEDGREYYAINHDADWERIRQDEWLVKNVVANLPLREGKSPDPPIQGSRKWYLNLDYKSPLYRPQCLIANEVREFLLSEYSPSKGVTIGSGKPELWAYYAAYDHVALAQLLGGKMIHLPKGIPMWTHDLMQLIEPLGAEFVRPEQLDQHNALADARWNKKLYESAMIALDQQKQLGWNGFE